MDFGDCEYVALESELRWLASCEGRSAVTITEYLGTQRRAMLLLLGALLFAAVGTVDYLMHANDLLEFSPFYLVPISFFSWFIGRRSGVALALLSVVVSFLIRVTAVPRAVTYGDAFVRFILYLSSVWMIAQLKKLYDHERHLSRIDPLTMVENRRAFFEAAARAKSFADRHDASISIAYLDLDNFKQFNDHWGHTTGDKLLAEVAHEIREALRPTDVIARIGGDEFAVLLPETDKETAARILSRVQIELDCAMRERQWKMTFSIGLASFSPPLASIPEMIRSADEAMYAAKNQVKEPA